MINLPEAELLLSWLKKLFQEGPIKWIAVFN